MACWPISWMEPDSSSRRDGCFHAARGFGGGRGSGNHPVERVLGDLPQHRAGQRQRSGGLLDRLDNRADGAVEFRNRRVDGVAPGVRGPLGGLPMQGHGVRHVEGDDLRHDFGPLGEFGGRETMCAGERVERPAQDGVPGRTANPRVEADFSLPLDGAPARFGIASIEIAAQQSLEVRELELGDRFTMRRYALPDRQFQNAVDDLFDRPVDGRRNDRPYGGEDRTNAIVDLVEGASGFEFGN